MNASTLILRTIKQSHRVLFVLLAFLLLSSSVNAQESGCYDDNYSECRGYRNIVYLVNDIDSLERPYAYLIGGMEYWILEIIGALAILGAIGFGLVHGFGRIIANKMNPIRLEKDKSVYIYKLIIRCGHWVNAIAVITLLTTGFLMHYIGPTHSLGRAHNVAGYLFVVYWVLFILYEILTLDIKQYIVQGWEIKGGILKQALFYAIGIFKQEEHPYHMKFENRLNPLQKVAYFSIMFFLIPFVGFTGFVLLEPELMSFVVKSFGMENMKYVFIAHLAGAFAMAAYLFGHLYLATTGDKVSQHYKVMVTGYHDEYKRIK